jgi:hypothetical protein
MPSRPEIDQEKPIFSALRSAVEHPFRVLKRQFGYVQRFPSLLGPAVP